MIPTNHELLQFAEVFRTKHVSNSAIRLGITQPALTQTIKKLEAKVGGKLFHRSSQGMVPTRLGVILYKHASSLRESWSRLQDELRAAQMNLSGRFRVGCHTSVASYCIPGVLRELDRTAPGIELELTHDYSRRILEKVISFELDLGFVINAIRHPDLVLKPIGKDSVRFWSKTGKPSVPHRLITDLSMTQTADLLGKSGHFKGWTILQSASLEVIRSLTLNGLGVGCIPQRVALADGALLTPYRPNELPEFHDRIFLAYRKDAMIGEASQSLVRACSQVLAR